MAQPVPAEVLDRFRMEERFECWNRGEFDLMLEPYADDALFDVSAVFTDVPPVRGHEDMSRSWHELRETWDGLRLDPVEVLDAGDGRYVVDLRLWGKGRRSGAEVDQRFAMLYTIRSDGKYVAAQLFSGVAAAISAAESSPSQAA
ncbi:MAG: nuclear transport factor 2 family protein [Solirubrobacterales bacterium]